MARGKAQPYTLGEFGDRKATVLLQLRKNLAINPVNLEESPRAQRSADYLWK